MHKLHNLKDKLLQELEEFSEQSLSESSLKSIDTLAHAIKNIDKVIDSCDYEDGYSESMGYVRDEPYVRPDGSYSTRGRGAGAKRDSMGRYSKADDIRGELHKLMNSVHDEHAKEEIRHLMEKM